LLTTGANELLAPIHDRMPVILPTSAYDTWLDPNIHDPKRLQPVLVPFPADEMEAYPVSRLVNDPENDVPACIQPIHREDWMRGLSSSFVQSNSWDGGLLRMRTIDRQLVAANWASRGFRCDLWTDRPGQRWEDFTHLTDELAAVLEGEMEFEVTGRVCHPEIGEELLIPAGAIHSTHNIGTTSARWLYGHKG
jgi:mannose-6-phosphate isomerase-like protein (cupin superfamily)